MAASAAEPVFNCQDGGRYFRVYAGPGTAYRGYYKSFAMHTAKNPSGYVVEQYRCQKQAARGFKCTKGDYIVDAYYNQGQKRVNVSLSGDFGPFDSGYLHSLGCD